MKTKNSIYVKKNMLYYFKLSSRALSDRKVEQRRQNHCNMSRWKIRRKCMEIPRTLCSSLPHFQNGGFYREKVYCIERLENLLTNSVNLFQLIDEHQYNGIIDATQHVSQTREDRTGQRQHMTLLFITLELGDQGMRSLLTSYLF